MLGGKTDRVTAEKMDRPNEIMIGGNRRREDAGKFRERDRDGGDRAGLDNEKQRPAEEEAE